MGRRVFGAGEPVEAVDDDSVARTFAGGARTPTAPAAPIVAQQLIDASIAQHIAQADPHPQYTTEAEATAIAEAAAAAVSGSQQVFVVAEGMLPALPLPGAAICIERLNNGNRRVFFTDGAA